MQKHSLIRDHPHRSIPTMSSTTATMRQAIDTAISEKQDWFIDLSNKLKRDFEFDHGGVSESEQTAVLLRLLAIQSALVANFKHNYGPVTLADAMHLMSNILPDHSGYVRMLKPAADNGTFHTDAEYWPEYDPAFC